MNNGGKTPKNVKWQITLFFLFIFLFLIPQIVSQNLLTETLLIIIYTDMKDQQGTCLNRRVRTTQGRIEHFQVFSD